MNCHIREKSQLLKRISYWNSEKKQNLKLQLNQKKKKEILIIRNEVILRTNSEGFSSKGLFSLKF